MIIGDPIKNGKRRYRLQCVMSDGGPVYLPLCISVSQVTARLRSMEPVITATLLHTTARSSPTTPSNMRTL